MQAAFEELNVGLTSVGFLAYCGYGKPFVRFTDASRKLLGAFPSQADDNDLYHPIHYASLALFSAASDYSLFESDTIGVTLAVKNFANIQHGTDSNCTPTTRTCNMFST